MYKSVQCLWTSQVFRQLTDIEQIALSVLNLTYFKDFPEKHKDFHHSLNLKVKATQ